MKTSDLNIYGGNENIMRGFEIALAGKFKIKLINSQDEDSALSPKQFKVLKAHLEDTITENEDHAEIFMEVIKPQLSDLIHRRNYETKQDIINRVKDTLEKAGDNLPEIINDAGMSLLKTAYGRLAFMPYEVAIIIDVVRTIAILDNPKTTEINVAHLAEAIQYRSLPREIREPLK